MRFRVMNLDYISKDDGKELAVFMATPGFLPVHFDYFFGWVSRAQKANSKEIANHFGDVTELANRNAASITKFDGLEMLALLLERAPRFSKPMPFWVSMALREADLKVVASKLRVRAERLRHWRDATAFDPLSLSPYP